MNILFKVCKRTIERGSFPDDMAMRINVFYVAGLINTEEYNTLIGMISK